MRRSSASPSVSLQSACPWNMHPRQGGTEHKEHIAEKSYGIQLNVCLTRAGKYINIRTETNIRSKT